MKLQSELQSIISVYDRKLQNLWEQRNDILYPLDISITWRMDNECNSHIFLFFEVVSIVERESLYNMVRDIDICLVLF